MKKDFIKLVDGKYAFTDEDGNINLIKCDRGEDFVYILLCKEDKLERLEHSNRIWMSTISRIRECERKRKKWNRNYVILVPISVFLFFVLKPIALSLALLSSLGLLGFYKLFINYTCGRKKDNNIKLEYANNKYNENKINIHVLREEIEKLKKESNYKIVDRDNINNGKKYNYEFRGNNLVYDDGSSVRVVHRARILSNKNERKY